MKNFTPLLLLLSLILFAANRMIAQAPNLGSTADFALFTSVGAITNTGISQITGNVGSNSGAGTGFGNVNGVMHSGNGTTAQGAADLNLAYNQLNTAIPNFFVAPLLGNGDTLLPGVYHISGVTTLNGNLILNALGNPNAVFIFQIQAAFSTNASSKIKLINGAMACNVFWKVEGLVDMASQTYMRGTIIAHNAGINMNTLDTLEGRALSTNGAISMNGVMAFTPIGCGSPALNGPAIPSLGSASCYTLFTSNGAMTNAGVSTISGDVGTNVGLTTGFDPLLVNGAIHSIPDGSTAVAANDLLNASNLMNIMPHDIELLYPAQFGNGLVLTPHTYILNAATSITGSIYLNALGNSNAVFLIKINGALSTGSASNVILMNGTQADNVYWLVTGAVEINSNSMFNGNLIVRNGAVNIMPTGVQLNGRCLTTDGAFATSSVAAISPSPCFALPFNWIYMNGQAIQEDVHLTWGVSKSMNNDFFLIEKSKDGILFETLAKVMAEDAHMTTKNEYKFVDHQPYSSTYYRISQTDIDGHSSMYKTIHVSSSKNELIVKLNVSGSSIDIHLDNASEGNGRIELYTTQGDCITSLPIQLKNESNQIQLPKPHHVGMYLMKIIEEGVTVYYGKVMVQ